MTEAPTHELELTEAELTRLMMGPPHLSTDTDVVMIGKLVKAAHEKAKLTGSACLELDSEEWRELAVAFQPHYTPSDEELLNKITGLPGVRVQP